MPDWAAFGERPAAVAEKAVLIGQGVESGHDDVADAGGSQTGRTISRKVELPVVRAMAPAEECRVGWRSSQHGVAQVWTDFV